MQQYAEHERAAYRGLIRQIESLLRSYSSPDDAQTRARIIGDYRHRIGDAWRRHDHIAYALLREQFRMYLRGQVELIEGEAASLAQIAPMEAARDAESARLDRLRKWGARALGGAGKAAATLSLGLATAVVGGLAANTLQPGVGIALFAGSVSIGSISLVCFVTRARLVWEDEQL